MEPNFNFEFTASETNLVLSALTTFTAPLINKIQGQAKAQIVQNTSDTINADSEGGTHD